MDTRERVYDEVRYEVGNDSIAERLTDAVCAIFAEERAVGRATYEVGLKLQEELDAAKKSAMDTALDVTIAQVAADRDRWRKNAGINLVGCVRMAKRAEAAEAREAALVSALERLHAYYTALGSERVAADIVACRITSVLSDPVNARFPTDLLVATEPVDAKADRRAMRDRCAAVCAANAKKWRDLIALGGAQSNWRGVSAHEEDAAAIMAIPLADATEPKAGEAR